LVSQVASPGAIFVALPQNPSLGILYGDGHGEQAEFYLYGLLFPDLSNRNVNISWTWLRRTFCNSVKNFYTLSAHSSIPWDKPFYKYKILHPIAWILERFISTPATHHAHHADTFDDGVGYYKGNFGNMFFLWDVIFGTGLITRKYPSSYGIKFYKEEEWYAQFLWPIFKSKKKGSELAVHGPEVGDEKPIFEGAKVTHTPMQVKLKPVLKS